MPTNTSKFNLVKPLKSEKYNVDVFNGNADIIDSQIYSKTEVDTALNGKAPLVHTHPISDVTNLQTALNGKANTTTTVNNQPLSSNITINASDVPNTPAGNISATNVQNAINELDTEKVDKLMATNLITNGDFSNGTTGWTGIDSIVGGVAEKTATVQFQNISFSLLNPTLYRGRRLYLRTLFKADSTLTELIISDAITLTGIRHSGSNLFESMSVIHTVNASANNVFCRVQDNRVSGWTKMEVDNFVCLDLTSIFGAGNEPTREQMDRLLSVYPNSWFNGTSEIGSIRALMRASLGGRVVTPTLLNSRTGTAQYVVSNDGLVIFRGTASGGSLNTNIFVLPENIRPTATRTFPISANNAFGVITVAANGEVRQTVGALTNVFLDGIAFKVGV